MAFAGCNNLESIAIPDSVLSIDDYAFASCTSLTDIKFPDSVEYIGGNAFESCTSLKSIVIPNSVTLIGDHAFNLCENLKYITVPASVKKIGEKAFGYHYIADMDTGNDFKYDNISFYVGKNTAAEKYAKDNDFEFIAHGNIVESGYCGVYSENKGENITWTLDSEGTLIIWGKGTMADYRSEETPWFDSCDDIKKVVVAGGVKNIGNHAFYKCNKLAEVKLSDSVKTIGPYAFCFCYDLESIYIPHSVDTISSYAFQDCIKLKEINVPDRVDFIGRNAFYGCTSLTSITIPNAVETIWEYTFYKCTNLSSVIISSSVTSICRNAFDNCPKLKSVTVPDSVKSITFNAFGYYTDKSYITKKVEGFTIKGGKGSAAEEYALDNGFKFRAFDGDANRYPVVSSEVRGRQFRLKWTAVAGAEKYGIAVYQAGKWRVKVQVDGNVTSYTSPKVETGNYKVVICAKVNGKWDTGCINQRAFTVKIA